MRLEKKGLNVWTFNAKKIFFLPEKPDNSFRNKSRNMQLGVNKKNRLLIKPGDCTIKIPGAMHQTILNKRNWFSNKFTSND